MYEKAKKIVILGGGFGGMSAAIQLDKTLARDSDVEVTLVNRENFSLFTPIFYFVCQLPTPLSGGAVETTH